MWTETSLRFVPIQHQVAQKEEEQIFHLDSAQMGKGHSNYQVRYEY